MEYGNWNDRYGNQPQQNPNVTQKTSKSGVHVSTLIICMLVTALLGGVLGVFLTRSTLEKSVTEQVAAALQQQQGSVSAAENTTASTLGSAASSGLTTLAPAGDLTGYSKAQIIELCAPSVVGIDVVGTTTYSGYFGQGQTYQTEGSGSGIIVTSDGYIVTCEHVIDGAESITVILNDDTEYTATLVGVDSRNDLAVIKIDATGLTPATLGDSDMLTVGEDVIAIGNPLGELRGTATGGMISAVSREVNVEGVKMTLLQTDAAISPGNSGGGLFNSSGSLIGIVNAKASSENAEGIGFAIPVSSVKQIISDLIDKGYVTGRPYLGVYTQNVTLQSGNNGWNGNGFFGSYYGNAGNQCVQIAQIVSGSAAEAAGLQVGDLILKVEDTQITSNDDLSTAISAYNAGDTVTLTIQRDGVEQTLTVTFGEYSPNA